MRSIGSAAADPDDLGDPIQEQLDTAGDGARGRRLLFLTLLGVNCLPVIASTAAAPTLPELSRAFADTADVERLIPLVLTLSPLAIALVGPLVGMVLDRWGRRRVLLAGTVLYGVAGASAALLTTLRGVLVTRLLLGVAVACVLTGATTVISDRYHGTQRARVLAIQAGIVGVVGTAVIFLSGVLAAIDWRLPFAVYLIALPIVPFVALTIRDTGKVHGDAAGASDGDPRDEVPAVPVAAQTALAADDVAVDEPTESAASRDRDIRHPHGHAVVIIVGLYATMAVLQITNFLVAVHLPFDLEERFGAGPVLAGAGVALGTLAYSAGALLSVRLAQERSPRSVAAIAFATVGTGYVVLGYGGLGAVLPAAFLAGVGFGLLVPNLIVWLAVVAPPAWRGRLFGGLTSALFLGQFASPFVWQPVIDVLGRPGAFALGGALSLVVAVGLVAWRHLRPLRVPVPTGQGAAPA